MSRDRRGSQVRLDGRDEDSDADITDMALDGAEGDTGFAHAVSHAINDKSFRLGVDDSLTQ